MMQVQTGPQGQFWHFMVLSLSTRMIVCPIKRMPRGSLTPIRENFLAKGLPGFFEVDLGVVQVVLGVLQDQLAILIAKGAADLAGNTRHK